MPRGPASERSRLTVLAADAGPACRPRQRSRPRDLRVYAPLFKALADPTRLEIVALLADAREPLCVCDIEAHFELAQATVSHHLKILRKAGVLESERRGTWIFYSIDPTALARIAEFAPLVER